MSTIDTGLRRPTGLDISGLTVTYRDPGRGSVPRTLVHEVSLDLRPGRIFGVAGESGSGKTMTGLAVLGLLPSGASASGAIRFGGRDLLTAGRRELERVRGRDIAMIFQDPSTSLHPMLRIGTQLTDHMRRHLGLGRKEAMDRARDLLTRVSIHDPAAALEKYPHQFSGGMRQRIAIAIALACDPAVVIADEPTTALDVTVQAGVLRLLRRLCDELGVAMMLVTHDLGVMSAIADDVAVMRRGEIVEVGSRFDVLTAPQHPYTRELIASLPGNRIGDPLTHPEEGR
jgi:peptide/nickel transport system ATP-binding protein